MKVQGSCMVDKLKTFILLSASLLISSVGFSEDTVLVLECDDINTKINDEWVVVINNRAGSITFHDRIFEKNFQIVQESSAYSKHVTAERVKTYSGNTTYYEFIEYNYDTRLLIRASTEVPITISHPRLESPETDASISKCKIK